MGKEVGELKGYLVGRGYSLTIHKHFEVTMEEFLFHLAHWHTVLTHQHRVHVAHATKGGAVTALPTHHIPTASTVMLCKKKCPLK